MDFCRARTVAIGSVLLFIPRIHIHEPNDFDAFKGVFGRCLTLGVGTKGASSRKVSVRVPHEMTGSLPGQPPFRRWILRLKYSDRDQPERVCQKMEIRNDDSWQ